MPIYRQYESERSPPMASVSVCHCPHFPVGRTNKVPVSKMHQRPAHQSSGMPVDAHALPITMGPLGQSISMNFEAALCLQSGRPIEAVNILKVAIDLLRDAVFTTEWDEQISTQPLMASVCQNPSLQCKQSVYNRDGTLYIYDRAMLPGADFIQVSSGALDANLFRIVSMYTMFNLALAHHLCGRLYGDSVASKRAIHLYQIVLMETNTGGVMNNKRTALLQCLILNNLADVHHELCDHQFSKCCMDGMAETIEQTKCFDNTGVLYDNEVVEITLNLVLSQVTLAAQAA